MTEDLEELSRQATEELREETGDPEVEVRFVDLSDALMDHEYAHDRLGKMREVFEQEGGCSLEQLEAMEEELIDMALSACCQATAMSCLIACNHVRGAMAVVVEEEEDVAPNYAEMMRCQARASHMAGARARFELAMTAMEALAERNEDAKRQEAELTAPPPMWGQGSQEPS